MATKKQHRTLSDYLTYTASTTQSLALPRDGVITEVLLDVRFTASKAYVGVCEDAVGYLLNVLKIVGPGETSYFSVTDGRMAQWYNHFTNKVVYFDTITSTGECHAIIKLHFGCQPDNPYDMTAAIPANTIDKGQLSSLNLRWTTPANTVMDCGTSASTISTAYIYVTVFEVLNSPSPMFEPRNEEVDWAADNTYSALGKKWDVPTGCYVRRLIMLANDHTSYAANTGTGSVRKDDQVTRIGLILPQEGNREVFSVDQWEAKLTGAAGAGPVFYGDTYCVETGTSAAATTKATGCIGMPAGVYCIDFRKYADPTINPFGSLAGMDMRNKQPGNVKLGVTIGTNTSGDDVHLLWDELVPIAK